MSIPGFSPFPEIPKRSTPEADFDAKMYALFQHFATTHRNELLAFIEFLETNSVVIGAALNGTTIGLSDPAAAKFTDLEADSIGGAAVMQDPYDATAGRLMTVPAFGLGMNAGGIETTLLAAALSNGIYRYSGSDPDEPSGHGREGAVIVYRTGGARVRQVAYEGSSEQTIYMRRSDDDGANWSGWHEVLTIDEYGRIARDIEVRNSAPVLAVTDSGTGVKHEISGSSSVGNLYIRTDPDETLEGADLVIETQGRRQITVSKDEVEFEVPIKGSLGIGADDPVAALHIKGSGVQDSRAVFQRGNVTGAVGIVSFDVLISGTGSTGENGGINFYTGGMSNARLAPDGTFRPGNDNTQPLGFPSFRWSQVYAGTGTISTSDARSKQDIQGLDAAERRVAVVAKGLLKKFRMRDAVAKKGDTARWHFGVIAQELAAAFEAEGLDPWRYGVLCWDEWWSAEVEIPAETAPITDENGVPTGEVETLVEARTELQTFSSAENAPAGATYHDRQGVRYDELFAFILAAI
ncbi:tail fiber domain-containing protein [Epibacterium sp. Ofav1-8]|uniref:tail fiber domain-containing protein n=1 Tax=Epibacterium sp. Ofav1-8 TaxID=2917735 RepID=UPI001EF72246|nr:tail fiber domain-containing protein [Epibacterium sp. Ofav1-8]MCG7622766.1 tail fiber domain-containing protein [Epibacterium sp. Ofav1-8]